MTKTFSKQLFRVVVLLMVAGSFAFLPSASNKIYVSNYENVLGTSMEIKVLARGEKTATKAEEAALAEIDRLNKILSGYDPSSEFSQWMKAGKTSKSISPELFKVLELFEQWRIKSNGALDASAETISSLWRNASKQNRVPVSQRDSNGITPGSSAALYFKQKK